MEFVACVIMVAIDSTRIIGTDRETHGQHHQQGPWRRNRTSRGQSTCTDAWMESFPE